MEATIRALRQGDTLSFGLCFLSLVATKLKLHMRADGRGINIPLADGSTVYFPYDGFTVDPSFGWTIRFEENGVKYQLRMGGNKPTLYKSVTIPGLEGERWQECDLTH